MIEYYLRRIVIFKFPSRNLVFKDVKNTLPYSDKYFFVGFSTGVASKMYEFSWGPFYTPERDKEYVKASQTCTLKKWEI